MGRIGFKKGKDPIKKLNPQTVNQAGGKAFTANDPITRLIGSAASWMGGEPGFYPDKATGHKSKYCKKVLDQRGVALVDTAIEIAESTTPEDLLVIINWIRNDMHMRTVSSLLLAVAARFIKTTSDTENPVTRYTPAICTRPDDLLQVHAIYNALFGKKEKGQSYCKARIPNSLQKGYAYALKGYSFYQLLKWNTDSKHPNFSDVLRSMRGVSLPQEDRAPTGFPIHQGMHRYLLDGTITEKAPAILRARKKFMSLNAKTVTIDDSLLDLAQEAGLTWENISTKFGGQTDPKRKAQLWNLNIKQMGYMAKLRNLRNLLDNGVEDSAIKKVSNHLANKDAVLKSKQLPFRYWSAVKALEAGGSNRATRQYVIDNLTKALDVSVENVPVFNGDTAILVDISGSMNTRVSEKSEITMQEAAAILGAIIYKRNPGAQLYGFAEQRFEVTGISRHDSVMSIARKMIEMSPNFGATYAHEALYTFVKERNRVDRMVFLTDMQAYGTEHPPYYHYGRASMYHKAPYDNTQAAIRDYRSNVNAKAFMHFVNLQGYEQNLTRVQGDPYSNQVAGFSEKLIGVLVNYEDGVTGSGTSNKPKISTSSGTPNINELRSKFSCHTGSHRKSNKRNGRPGTDISAQSSEDSVSTEPQFVDSELL